MPRVVVVSGIGNKPSDAYEILRAQIAKYCDLAMDAIQIERLCLHCGSTEHGRPFVVPSVQLPLPPAVSLSRSTDFVLVAVSDAGPVGVDVELGDAAAFAGFNDVALHPREVAGTSAEKTRTWVRKESLLKATGHGLTIDPRELRLSGPGHPPEVLDWPSALQPATAWMWDFDFPLGRIGAVTVLSVARPELHGYQKTPTN